MTFNHPSIIIVDVYFFNLQVEATKGRNCCNGSMRCVLVHVLLFWSWPASPCIKRVANKMFRLFLTELLISLSQCKRNARCYSHYNFVANLLVKVTLFQALIVALFSNPPTVISVISSFWCCTNCYRFCHYGFFGFQASHIHLPAVPKLFFIKNIFFSSLLQVAESCTERE